MKLTLLIVACLVPLILANLYLYQEDEYRTLFDSFRATHNKTYSTAEEHAHRYEIFKSNADFVKRHNSEGHSYTVGINQFADLTLEEFSAKYLRPMAPKTGRGGYGMTTHGTQTGSVGLSSSPMMLRNTGSGTCSNKGTCGTYPSHTCNNCGYCFNTTEGTGACSSGGFCGQLQVCTKSSQCLKGFQCVSSCCGGGVCAPTCPSTLPTTISWVSTNNPYGRSILTGIRDQGQCGSCWSFAAVAATEGVCDQVLGGLSSLSEQELVDCSLPEGNQGCNGGFADDAFSYIIYHKGLSSRSTYPYKASEQTHCGESCSTRYCGIHGYVDIPKQSLSGLLTASSQQAVAVAIDANHQSFQHYKSGIYSEPACTTVLDHAVTVVGYGPGYWLIRNSWGTTWGEAGYMQMYRSTATSGSGMCGIAMEASYPLF
jgi:Papain family cysteine protease/Cathepsin propeptide inhibitor domain (I29)